MVTIFRLKTVYPFFLLGLQRPLAGTIISFLEKLNDNYYIFVDTNTESQINSFMNKMKEYGEFTKIGKSYSCDMNSWHFEPNKKV